MEKAGVFSFGKNLKTIGDSGRAIRDLSSQLEDVARGRDGRGDRKKLKHVLEEARLESRRAFLKLVAGAGLIGAAGSGIVLVVRALTIKNQEGSASQPTGTASSREILAAPPAVEIPKNVGIKQFTRIAPFSTLGSEGLDSTLKHTGYWQKVSTEALQMFEKADPAVADLNSFMQRKALYALPIDSHATQFLIQGEQDVGKILADTQRFELIFMPEDLGSWMESSIITEEGGKTLRVAANFMCKEWLGIMLVHELSHVYDQRVLGENAGDPDQYNEGEVKAHLLEMKLLRSWDPTTYNFFIQAGIPLYEEGVNTNNFKPLMKFIAALYPTESPPLSPHEAELAGASCLTAVAFESSLRNGADHKQLAKTYRFLRNRFHGQ